MDGITNRVAELRACRTQIAEKSMCLAERELDGRILRLQIEVALRGQGRTKTDAERDAKADDRYLAHERASIQIAFDRALLEAKAEALRLTVQAHLVEAGHDSLVDA